MLSYEGEGEMGVIIFEGSKLAMTQLFVLVLVDVDVG